MHFGVRAGSGAIGDERKRERAKHAGADAALVVTPYYDKPTQEGLLRHFKAVNEAVGIPILICNIPPRSVVDMSVDRMMRLYELENIVGIKDATSDVGRVSRQRYALRGMCKIQPQMFRRKRPLPALSRRSGGGVVSEYPLLPGVWLGAIVQSVDKRNGFKRQRGNPRRDLRGGVTKTPG